MGMRLLAAAAAALLVFGGPASAAEPVKLRLGFATTLAGPAGQGAEELARLVKEETGGAIEIELFPAAQLGGELDMVSQVRLGTLDMAMVGSGVTATVEPTFAVTELPFIWKSREAAWSVLNGPVGQKILASLEPKGIKALAWGAWDYRGMITNGFAIATPEDLKGRRIRVVENPVYVQTIRAFGGSPVPMAWTEVYSGLQQKTIDGVDTSYFAFVEAKLYEVAGDLSVTDHIFSATVFMINLERFQALTPEQQQALLKGAKAGGDVMRESVTKANEDAIGFLEEKGIVVTRPDPAQFSSLVEPVHKHFAAIVGADLLEAVKAAQQ